MQVEFYDISKDKIIPWLASQFTTEHFKRMQINLNVEGNYSKSSIINIDD